MKTKFASLAALVALAMLSPGGETGGRPPQGRWPDDFVLRAKKHIEAITAIGPRPAGSPNEGRAAAYVAGQFLSMGIIPRIEPFSFETFEPEGVRMRIGERIFEPAGLGVDPYSGESGASYSGEFLLLDSRSTSDWPPAGAVAGKAVVTLETGYASLHFRIAALMPRCLIYLSPDDFDHVKGLKDRKLSLFFRGGNLGGTSRNVIARLGPNPPARQIIVGAHLDAYRDNPGANDNASGVAALLELARYLKGLGEPDGIGLTFIAFGAEEAGILGSRRYVESHAAELKDCPLALVLDDLGGEGPVHIERDGGRPDSPRDPGTSRIPGIYQGRSWEGFRYPWKLLPPPELFAAIGKPYHPGWLVEGIDEAVKGLGFDVEFTEIQGSDQMSFAQAGIATSGISAPNGRGHTPDDRPETVSLEKVRQCAEAAGSIIREVLDRLSPASPGSPGFACPLDPMAHVRFLASDELGGRRAGSCEGEIAAAYIRECLRKAGVAPLPGAPEYFQNVDLPEPSPSSYKGPNVIGFIRGSDAKRAREFVLLAAHYDHLGRKSENGAEAIYNGARDNAMGVAALLAAAHALALDPPARSVIILAATAEEVGMIGSRFFVEHPPIPLSRIVFVLNNDGAGVTRPGLWRIGGLEQTTAEPLVEAAGLAFGLIKKPYPEKFRFLFAKGDAASFIDKGIPALTVSPGFSEGDEELISRYIHTPADRVDTDFDEGYMTRFSLAFADLARRIADAETVPSRAASSSLRDNGGSSSGSGRRPGALLYPDDSDNIRPRR